MIVPLIVTGHTSCKDKNTIIDTRGDQIDVIKNIDICKRNNPNIQFYTIYSVDDSIYSQTYFDYFDEVLYSEDIPQRYVGEKVKVETALNYIVSEKNVEWGSFIKICSRTVLNNIEQYIVMTNKYDYIGNNHQTSVQYDTSMFIGNIKLLNTWINCEPKIEIALSIKCEKNWLDLYGCLLLENLFYNSCKIDNIKEFLMTGLYTCKYVPKTGVIV